MERPGGLAGKQVFTDPEAAAFEEAENRRQNRDLIDPKKGGGQYPPGGVIPYNEFWYERGSRVIGSKRTSLVVDPSDGRIPPMTEDGQRRLDARLAAGRNQELGRSRTDSAEDRSLADRCIVGFNAGPPMTPGAYNNHVQIVQTAGYVVLISEMVHDARVISLEDGNPAPGHLRQYHGVSRGHWEGSALVIVTTSFRRETSFPESTANLRLVERLTRVDAGTLLYEFTVDDPHTWTRPWSVAIPMMKTSGPIYEYACHEGNYAMFNILSGARAEERKR